MIPNHPKIDSRCFVFILMTSLVSLGIFPGYLCQNDQQYETCSRSFQCGSMTDIGYPFWGGDRPVSCGYPGLELNCQDDNPLLNISSTLYTILNINNSNKTLRITRNDLWTTICPALVFDTTLDFTLFDYSSSSNDQNITLYYGCTADQVQLPSEFSCNVNGTTSSSFYATGQTSGLGTGITCNRSISVPVNQTAAQALASPTVGSTIVLQDALMSGFSVQWFANNENCVNCVRSGGVCGYNEVTESFACYCADQPYDLTCNNNRSGNGIGIRSGNGIGIRNRNGRMIATVAFNLVLGISISTSTYFCWRFVLKNRVFNAGRKQKNEMSLSRDAKILQKSILKRNMHEVKLDELPCFTFEMLSNATDKFASINKLGQGGYGPVYKGKLPNGQEVAVKRLSRSSNQGMEEFMNEVEVISKLQHQNLVRLLGCCVESEEKMLIYEYMPNGSLDAYLFDSDNREFLDWGKRVIIIEGICRGLLYLHRDSRLRIIHRDLKASNILLDEELNPKISDFGMARIFLRKEDQANTKRIVGTYGYMAPEYALYGVISEKSDVYSFGVLLLEILIGKKNSSFYDEEQNLFLIAYAWKLWNEENIVNLMDPGIYDPRMKFEIMRYANVGLLCVQEIAADRPNISTVLSMLSHEIVELPRPNQPAFVVIQRPSEIEIFPVNPSKCSVNDVTMTTVEGR